MKMDRCAECDIPLIDFRVRLLEIYKKNYVTFLEFCSFLCLVKFTIDKGMVVAEVKPCS